MIKLDPQTIFARIVNDIPKDLHKDVFVTGSLAAAYHHRATLEGYAVNTKDADLVVHPAGNLRSCRAMAERMLETGWTRTERCEPRRSPSPEEDLEAIRLYPPKSHDYFVEFLNLPDQTQKEAKRFFPIELSDGFYCLPSFRFMALTSLYRQTSIEGLEYASPSMMALSNLLSHSTVGEQQMESGPFRGLRRSAKDLGRVIALTRLAGAEQLTKWKDEWRDGLVTCFREDAKELASHVGDGLKELLNNESALEEARRIAEVGLLSGLGVTRSQLRGLGNRLIEEVVQPLGDALK